MYEIWSVGHKPFENLKNNDVSEIYMIALLCWALDFPLRSGLFAYLILETMQGVWGVWGDHDSNCMHKCVEFSFFTSLNSGDEITGHRISSPSSPWVSSCHLQHHDVVLVRLCIGMHKTL
jgi:hypothetical protein